MGKKQKGVCYYCGAQASSLEDAPPKQFFKGFACDSIKVPSCNEHNTAKCASDQAIVSAFLLALRSGSESYRLEAEIIKAIEKAEPSFVRAKRKAVSAPLISNPPECLAGLPPVAHLAASADIRSWVRQLTAALVYDASKAFDPHIKWNKAIAWSPNWIESDKPSPIELSHVLSEFRKKGDTRVRLDQLQWFEGWSAHPRKYPPSIYAFELHFESQLQEVVFCHRFYERFNWYVQFSATEATILKLVQKLPFGAK